MLIARLIAATLLVASCGMQNEHSNMKILGGKKDKIPFLAVITATQGGLTYKCSGIFISPYAVITAAHCLHEENKFFDAQDVEVGLTRYDDDNKYIGQSDSRIVEYKIHPNYWKKRDAQFDLAIVFIEKPFNKDYFAGDFCVSNVKPNSEVKLVGRGYSETTNLNKYNDSTQGGDSVPRTGIATISQVHSKTFETSGQFNLSGENKTGYAEYYVSEAGKNVNLAHGDSGGPALSAKNGKYCLAGIASGIAHHLSLAQKVYLSSIFTNLSAIENLNFIQQSIAFPLTEEKISQSFIVMLSNSKNLASQTYDQALQSCMQYRHRLPYANELKDVGENLAQEAPKGCFWSAASWIDTKAPYWSVESSGMADKKRNAKCFTRCVK